LGSDKSAPYRVGDVQEKTADALKRGGVISQGLRNFEFRAEQLQMAEAISKSIEAGSHLIVEAGTGIGKSLAYLIPFVIYAAENNKKVIVSTNTKTLQNQLHLKDLPFLKKTLGLKFNYSLCLGSENYICLRRLNSGHAHDLSDSDSQLEEMKKIEEWARTTGTGIKSEMGFIPRSGVWDNVCRESDLCLGKKCSCWNECFYKKAKKQEKRSHILITNHSLFYTNLASGGQVLPNFHAVVFDEAQTLEDVATSYLGLEVSDTKIKYLFDSIYNPKREKGLLTMFKKSHRRMVKEIETRLSESRKARDKFFCEIRQMFGEDVDSKRIRTKNIVPNYMEEPLERLSGALSGLLPYVKSEEDEALMKSYLKRCANLAGDLSFVLNHPRDDYVYWVEISRKRRGKKYSLFASPIEIAEELNKQLFEKIKPIVLTSATLSTNGNFDFIQGRLGIRDCDKLLLDSPFDYQNNVLLYLPREIEDPKHQFELFRKHVLEHIKEIVNIMKGRTFILFTSYKMLNEAFEDMASSCENINLLRQGAMPRYELLKNFKKNENSVLLGTATFWQGIDVPGKSLECVIITKLPFSVPDDPITEARMELIEYRGGNPFMEYQMPQAIMMFKQGFGRLIRARSDKGIVAVLDPRIRTRFYGRSFISALPECGHTDDIKDINSFFKYRLD